MANPNVSLPLAALLGGVCLLLLVVEAAGTCAASYYLSGTACVACPAGSYCAQAGLTAVTGACPQGYFCPAGSSATIPCPVGAYCPSASMSAPTPCLQGQYCATTALTATSGACATGNGFAWCPEGSSLSDRGTLDNCNVVYSANMPNNVGICNTYTTTGDHGYVFRRISCNWRQFCSCRFDINELYLYLWLLLCCTPHLAPRQIRSLQLPVHKLGSEVQSRVCISNRIFSCIVNKIAVYSYNS